MDIENSPNSEKEVSPKQKKKQKFLVGLVVAWFAVGAIVAAGTIYLTPLKHLNLIEPTIDDIPAGEFYNLYTENPNKYLFVDVRSQNAYEAEHAEGSINIPLHLLFDERKFLPKTDKEIVLICTGRRASGVGYSYLEHFGFLNLKRIEGGLNEWKEAGLPTNQGLVN